MKYAVEQPHEAFLKLSKGERDQYIFEKTRGNFAGRDV
jgi:hypothetical protein